MRTDTVGEHLYWYYANLAMAHAAVSDGAERYGPKHYGIRAHLYKGLLDGTMDVRPVVEDERLKMILPQACCYCGSQEHLAADHLVPRKRGGLDQGDNLVWSCRECNSSKGAEDVLFWHAKRESLPTLLVLRRYLKLAIAYAREQGIMDCSIDDCAETPFRFESLPRKLPPPNTLRLWVTDF